MEKVNPELEEFKENICDNFCKYRDTADENNECDGIREYGKCPLEKLDKIIK